MPRNVESNRTVQGILMFPKIKEYTLPNDMNFQQYIIEDNTFQDIMIMYHGKEEYKWIQMLADRDNKLSIDRVFQHINLLMYNILAESYSGQTGKGKFHLSMIKEMQKFTSSQFDSIFIEHYPTMYENTIMNNRFRWMLINWMKNKFLTDWIFKLISQMKD